MSKPFIHAQSSVKRHGGTVEDYLPLHNFMDSSKGAFPTNVHRALTHTSWFILVVGERIKFPNSVASPDGTFPTIKNSDGKQISVRQIFEEHILEDFGGKFIPTAQDYLQELAFKPWMQNGIDGYPPSYAQLQPLQELKKNEKLLSDLFPHEEEEDLARPPLKPKKPGIPWLDSRIID